MPGAGKYKASYHLVIGLVVGIHIDDRYIKDGLIDTAAMKPIARLGYMDYAVVTPETIFAINRPDVGPDGTIRQTRPTGTANTADHARRGRLGTAQRGAAPHLAS